MSHTDFRSPKNKVRKIPPFRCIFFVVKNELRGPNSAGNSSSRPEIPGRNFYISGNFEISFAQPSERVAVPGIRGPIKRSLLKICKYGTDGFKGSSKLGPPLC